jgi:hypothetical protein
MAPKSFTKKKLQIKKTKPTRKTAKMVTKPIEVDNTSNDDTDGSLDALEFNSE